VLFPIRTYTLIIIWSGFYLGQANELATELVIVGVLSFFLAVEIARTARAFAYPVRNTALFF